MTIEGYVPFLSPFSEVYWVPGSQQFWNVPLPLQVTDPAIREFRPRSPLVRKALIHIDAQEGSK